MEIDRTPAAAAAYIDWYGQGSNCLENARGDKRRHFEAARDIVRTAPVLLTVADPWRSFEIIAVLGSGRRVAYREVRPDDSRDPHRGWGCGFIEVEVGGATWPVAQYLLAPDSPSQVIHCEVHPGRRLALTPADADLLGIVRPRPKIDSLEVCAAFGAAVEMV